MKRISTRMKSIMPATLIPGIFGTCHHQNPTQAETGPNLDRPCCRCCCCCCCCRPESAQAQSFFDWGTLMSVVGGSGLGKTAGPVA